MSFINNALKTSAIVCMTAITVATGVATAGSIIYGPQIARSVINASDGIARASGSVEGLVASTNNSVKIINAHLGEACKAANVSMKSISDMLATLDYKITNFKEEDKKEIRELMISVTNIANAVSKKVNELDGVDSKEINEVVGEFRNTVKLLNNGIDSFFKECDEAGKREINKGRVRACIEWMIGRFFAIKE